MGIIYILTTIMAIVAFLLIKKSDKELNITSWMIFSLILYLCYNIFICFVLGNLNIHTNLICLSIVNFLVSLTLGFFIVKKKETQKYFWKKQDILAIIIIIETVFFVGNKQYRPFDKTVATASVDGCMHYSAATNFADNNIILSKIDNKTGYNFLTMQPGAYINTGILMNVIRSFSDNAKDYVTFKLFEISMFALNIALFYILIEKKLDTKYKFGIGMVFLLLYSFGYPYTSLLYGFSYLSVSIACSTGMLYLAKIYKEKEIYFLPEFICILLIGVGIIFSYCLFVPAMFAFICINVFLYEKDEKHKIFKKHTMWVTGSLLIITIVAILYLVVPTFLVSTQNKLTDAIGFDGGIYKGLYVDFLIYIPFTILFIYRSIKDKKMSPMLLALIVIGAQAFISLVGLIFGIVSSYYYYKIYYIIYTVFVYIAVEVITSNTENKELQICINTIIAVFVLLILCVSTEFEEKVHMKYPGLMDKIKSNELVGIYYDTNVFSVKNINVSCIVDANRVKLAEKVGEIQGITLKNILVGGMNTNCKAWLYVISGIECGGESINDLQVAIVETSVKDWLKDDEKEYFVLFTGEPYASTEEYDLLFQNDAGVILKKK